MSKKIFLLLLFFCTVHLAAAEDVSEKAHFKIMGTVASFEFSGAAAELPGLFADSRKSFEKLAVLANLYDPASELSKLNAVAAQQPFICSEELYSLLQAARIAWRDSGGAFDISAKPLMDLWGFYRKHRRTLPSKAELKRVLQQVGLEKVEFNDALRSVRFKVKGMQLDLGGIAKGYAVDRAFASASRRAGRMIIDLGGNLRIYDNSGRSSRVGIRDPLRSGGLAGVITVKNAAVSTSGNYEKFVTYNGKRYAHIIDPATGMPTENFLSVTVATGNAVTADWMSTAVFVRGTVLAHELVKKYPDTEFYICIADDSKRGYRVVSIKNSL